MYYKISDFSFGHHRNYRISRNLAEISPKFWTLNLGCSLVLCGMLHAAHIIWWLAWIISKYRIRKINHKGCQKREKVTINFLLQAVEAYKNWKHTAVVNRYLSHDVKVISSYHYLKCRSNTKLTEILRILNNGFVHSRYLIVHLQIINFWLAGSLLYVIFTSITT